MSSNTKNFAFRFIVATAIIALLISLISIFVYRDIINVPSAQFLNYMNRGRTYWDLFINMDENSMMLNIAYLVKYIFELVLFLDLIYIILNKKYKEFVNIKEVVITVCFMSFAYVVQKHITYNYIYYNKLYMIYFPTIILSLGILALSFFIIKRMKR